MKRAIEIQGDVEGEYMIWCEGCQCGHRVSTVRPNSAGGLWTFNGNVEHPTFAPSLLVRYKDSEGRVRKVCHSYVRDGKIQYLPDSTHQLAGQTLELKDINAF